MMRLPALFEIKEIIRMTHGEPEKIGLLMYYGREEICWVRLWSQPGLERRLLGKAVRWRILKVIHSRGYLLFYRGLHSGALIRIRIFNCFSRFCQETAGVI